MKIFHKITALALSLTTSLIMVGCGGGSTSSTTASSTTDTTPSTSTTTTENTQSTSSPTIGQGKLSILLTDAPGDFVAVYVTIAEVLVHREGTEGDDSDDGEWLSVATPNITYDLLKLQNGITTLMGDKIIPATDYTQLRLILGSDDDGAVSPLLERTHPFPHYIILEDDLEPYALKVPSNTIKYNHNFTILDNEVVEMMIDFDANKSIHPAGDKWILNPFLKVTTELQ
jgi:hypothetical protein